MSFYYARKISQIHRLVLMAKKRVRFKFDYILLEEISNTLIELKLSLLLLLIAQTTC